jgi:hypothetical protein
MKKLALVAAISLFAAGSVGSGLAQPPMPPPGAMPRVPPGMFPGMMRYGQHSMSGKVTKLDATTGMLSLDTKEGKLELHFPPASLANVKVGETMTVYLSFSMGEPGQMMQPPGMPQMPEMPRMPEQPPAPKAQ